MPRGGSPFRRNAGDPVGRGAGPTRLCPGTQRTGWSPAVGTVRTPVLDRELVIRVGRLPSDRPAGNSAGNPCNPCHSVRSVRGSSAGNTGFCVLSSTLARWKSLARIQRRPWQLKKRQGLNPSVSGYNPGCKTGDKSGEKTARFDVRRVSGSNAARLMRSGPSRKKWTSATNWRMGKGRVKWINYLHSDPPTNAGSRTRTAAAQST